MAEDKILATVVGKNITESDVSALLSQMGRRAAQYDNPQGRAVILDQLINQRLLLADAIANLYERDPEFKAEMAKAKDEMLMNYAVKKAVDHVKVTDEEIKAFYDAHPEQFGGQTTLNASHILVPDKETADKVNAELKAGTISFADAARKYSTCPSKENGGDLGDFTIGQMVPEFESACLCMEPGSTTEEPVQSQFGWHLIHLNSKSAGEKPDFAAVAPQIREQLLNEKQQKAFQSKIGQLRILHPVEKF